MNIATMSNLSGVSNCVSIVSQVIIAVGVIVGFWQFFKTMRFKKIEKAVELSKFYKDSVLNNNSDIINAYIDCDIIFDINKFQHNYLKYFDYRDVEKYGIHNFLKIMNSIKDDKVMSIVSDTLNNLEYFALNFNRKLANEDAIYQSIHQSYIQFVELLCVDICNANLEPNDDLKYYTNVIKLYNLWKKKSEARRRKIERLKANSRQKKENDEISKAKKIDKMVYDASNA